MQSPISKLLAIASHLEPLYSRLLAIEPLYDQLPQKTKSACEDLKQNKRIILDCIGDDVENFKAEAPLSEQELWRPLAELAGSIKILRLIAASRKSEILKPKDIEEFEKIVKSNPVSFVMVTGTFSVKNPENYYSVRVFFKEGTNDYVDAPINLSAEYIVKNFSKHLRIDHFKFYQKAFPGLIDDKMIKEKTDWDKKCDDESKAAFVNMMEKKIPMQSISTVKLGDMCYQTYPCQHEVSFYQKNDPDHPKLKEEFLSKDIADHYADFLDPHDFMHIRYCMDEETKERLTAKKLTSVLSSDVKHVSINSYVYGTIEGEGENLKLVPHKGISNLSINYKDGTNKYLDCKEPADIARYFGTYLDDASINIVSQFMTPEILASRTERMGKITSNSDRAKIGLFTHQQNSASKTNLAVNVTDEEMAKSAFGQSSNSAKKLASIKR